MNDAAITSRAARLPLAFAVVCVMAIAALLHSGGLHDVIAWDEANYAMAAERGILANAIQMGEVNELRHDHAPLMAYAIAASTACFGNDEWAIRLPVVIMSALSCGLLVLAGFDLSRGASIALRIVTGTFAGLMLATSPASIELAGVVQPHSFVVFFLVLNVWTLTRYLRDLCRRDALLFGLSLAGQFITMEYGPVVLVFALVAVGLARPERLLGASPTGIRTLRGWLIAMLRVPLSMHRDIKTAAIVCLIATMITWPAGVFLLGIPLNFAYYLFYAAHGHPILFRGQMQTHVPKYAYAYWYWLDHPALLVGMLAALLLIAAWAWRDRRPVAVTIAVFAFGLTASVHGSHIMQLCKSIFMIPTLALGGALAGAWLVQSTEQRVLLRRWLVPTCCLAIATILGGRITPMSRQADPNQRLIEMTRAIASEAAPNDRVLAQGWPMVRYLLNRKFNRGDIQVERYDPRNFESDHLGDRLHRREFAWAVTIGPTTAAHSRCQVLAELRSHWDVVIDQSMPGKEYRVYRTPDPHRPASIINRVASHEKERVAP